MTYRIDPLRDTARLIRGVIWPSSADPFIEQNFRAINSRDTLFRWDFHQSDDVPPALGDYQRYCSPEPLLIKHLPPGAGRRAFTSLMEAAPMRIRNITSLLSEQGIDMQPSAACWTNIASFLAAHITPGAKTLESVQARMPRSNNEWLMLRGEHFFSPIWHSVNYDLSLLMAHHAMLVRPELQWRFWADSSYEEPAAFGRSPWLEDTSSKEPQPVRTLLFEMMSTNFCNTLESRLRGEAESIESLSTLYSSLVERVIKA